MRSRIKPNNLQLKQRSIFRRNKQWMIAILSLFGIILIWQSSRWMIFEPSGNDLPDYTASMKRVDWNEYSKTGRAVGVLTKGWLYPNSTWPEESIRNFEQKISGESLKAQIAQIEQLFAEEEAFRKADLEKSLEAYRYKLNLEMGRELDVEINRLRTKYQKEISNRELNLKNAVSKFNEELAAEYQVTLANLQLQLLLIDLSNQVREPQLEKQKIQGQIDKIHQEMNAKLTIRQRQLTEELAQYKKQHQISLDLEVSMARNQMVQTVENAFSKYRSRLEAGFYQWREQRKQDVQMVINLRQNRL